MSESVPVINVIKALLVLVGMAIAAMYLIYRQDPGKIQILNRFVEKREQTFSEPIPDFSDYEADLRASADLDWSIIYRGGPAQRSRLAAAIKEASETYHLDQNLIRSIIMAESMFEVEAVSEKGAKGLMQLMPETAAQLGVKNPFDPRENIMAGSRYLSGMLKQFEGNLSLALAAYHSGLGTVLDYGNKVPSFSRDYVFLVASYYELFGADKNNYREGIYNLVPAGSDN